MLKGVCCIMKYKTRQERILGIIAIVLAAILVLAASIWYIVTRTPAGPDAQPTTTNSTAPTEAAVPTPKLYIRGPEATITAYLVCGNWGNAYFDTFPSKNFHKSDRMPRLYAEDTAAVTFDLPAERIEAICWNIEYYDKSDKHLYAEDASIVDGQLAVKPGTYIYQVSAKWSSSPVNHGEVTYLFLISTEPLEPISWPDPPDLLVSNGAESINASQVCATWAENGGYQACYDGPNANELLEWGRMPWLTSEMFAILEFETLPDRIEVQCWAAGQEIRSDGEIVALTGGKLQLKDGSYVYEVTAQWNSYREDHGRVVYVFAVTATQADSDTTSAENPGS